MRVSRVAYLSMHTSPLLQPGVGDAGGMNVYVDELARAMTARGIQVDVFTRRHARNQAPVVHVDGSYTVHHIDAGPYGAVPVAERAPYVAEFAEGVMARFEDGVPDIVHSHYWLSGWAGIVIKRRLGIPLAHSFHTLGRVKDLAKRGDDPPEPLLRIAAELEVIRAADCLIAATPLEAEDLMLYYRADPARICTSPPGVDHGLFHPGDSERARDRLGLPKRDPIVLYAGRIQPLKGVDVALEAVALLTQEIQDLRFCVVGGPSGRSGTRELARLRRRAGELGLEETVYFHPPRAPPGAGRLLPGGRRVGAAVPKRILRVGGGRSTGERVAGDRLSGGRPDPCGRRRQIRPVDRRLGTVRLRSRPPQGADRSGTGREYGPGRHRMVGAVLLGCNRLPVRRALPGCAPRFSVMRRTRVEGSTGRRVRGPSPQGRRVPVDGILWKSGRRWGKPLG